MSDTVKSALLVCLLTLAAPAFGGEIEGPIFDPTDFLKEQEFEAAKRRAAEAIETSNVVIGDRTYVRLTSEAGSIFIPKGDALKAEDLNLAFCGSTFKPVDLNSALEFTPELRLTEIVRRSTRLILNAIRSKCENKL